MVSHASWRQLLKLVKRIKETLKKKKKPSMQYLFQTRKMHACSGLLMEDDWKQWLDKSFLSTPRQQKLFNPKNNQSLHRHN